MGKGAMREGERRFREEEGDEARKEGGGGDGEIEVAASVLRRLQTLQSALTSPPLSLPSYIAPLGRNQAWGKTGPA